MGRRESLEKQFPGASAAIVPLLLREGVTDVLLNGTRSAFLEVEGRMQPIPPPFETDRTLFEFIERLVIPTGRRLEAARPFLDGRLCDGSRFHVILAPLAEPGPLVSLRLFATKRAWRLEDFAPGWAEWLTAEVRARKNFLIAGATGVGKTSLLSAMLETVPAHERLVVLEETRELTGRHPHVVFLEARSPTPEGVGGVTLSELVRHALRMRPDRLILGECRGPEAMDLLRALQTGHRGSFCTVHADSAAGALRRLEGLVLEANGRLPLALIREWIGQGVDWVLFLRRDGGRRWVSESLEVVGAEGALYRQRPGPCR